MNPVKLFKLRTGFVHANEDIIDKIKLYCLGQMKSSELDYSGWEISVCTKSIDIVDGKYFECQSFIEATQTKDFFLDFKTMSNGEDEGTDGAFLLVKRHLKND